MDKIEGLCVFIVPRLELIKQASDEFSDVDIIWSNKTKLTGKNTIVSSKDSLRTQYKKIPDVHPLTVIFDEAHIGIEQTYKLVNLIKPDRVLGLTATPERMDGLALTKGVSKLHQYGVFDDVLIAETIPTLIDKSYLSPLKYYTKPIDDITSIKPESAVSEELSGAQMMNLFDKHKIWGDLVTCYERYNPDKKPAVGFTNTITMAENVCKIFNEAGYDFRVISGKMSVSERRELLDALKNGDCDGLVNAALLTYGFDCPEIYYAFSCRHIKSRPLWFQMIGRILRVHESKSEAIFIDHGDSISEFMQPDCALPILDPFIQWQFNGTSKEEKAALNTKRKQANEVIRMINELDPQPTNLVEITTENLFTRLISIYNKLTKEIGSIKQLIKDAKVRESELIAENERLKKEKPQKVIDADKTFEYIRRNYCHKRRICDLQYSKIQGHNMTVKSFLDDEEKLPFYYDKRTFERSMTYWKTHYST